MRPGVWHRFVVSYVVSPRKGGEVKVWIDQDPDPVIDTHSFGFFNVGTCVEGSRPQQHFRVKFGIYKDTEPGKCFDVRYDDFRIGGGGNPVSEAGDPRGGVRIRRLHRPPPIG
jgi:hypothetical protein